MSDALPDSPSDDVPPILSGDLGALFEFLGRPNPRPGTQTFAETMVFLRSRGQEIRPKLAWLSRNGAGRDCEVSFNTEAEWGEWSGRVLSTDDDDD
jgi:hypothetical protein